LAAEIPTTMNHSFAYASSESTSNTCLAAALTAIGVPLAEKPFMQVVDTGGRERTVWFFAPVSLCGKYRSAKLIAAWNDEQWHLANPEHPFAYIKCAMINRERLVDKIKRKAPLVAIRRRGKIALVPMNATPRQEELILRQL
jgi:hypothetical protein